MSDTALAANDGGQTTVAQPEPAEALTPTTPAEKEAAIDKTAEAIWDKHNPPRENGKFVARTPADGRTTDQPQPKTVEQPGKEVAPQTPVVAIDMPKAWSADKKPLWDQLAPEARDYIAKRESEATRVISQYGNELAQIRPVRELLTANRDVFERHGADFGGGLAALLKAQRALDQDAPKAIAAIAEMYGVDLAKAFGQPPAPGEEGKEDPRIAALQGQVSELRNKLDQRERAERTVAQNQERALQAQTQEEVAKWLGDGTAKPHYADVRSLMAQLILNGEANTLDEAYDMACNAKPAIREKVQADAAKAKETERQLEQSRHVSEAKRVASLDVGKSGKRATPVASGKWDDDESLESLYYRVASG